MGRLQNMPEGEQPHLLRIHQDNLNITIWPNRNEGEVSHLQEVPDERVPEIKARMAAATDSHERMARRRSGGQPRSD